MGTDYFKKMITSIGGHRDFLKEDKSRSGNMLFLKTITSIGGRIQLTNKNLRSIGGHRLL